jgi:hypothetical protein
MSFGEYVNVGRFIQKASKVDPIVIFNHVHLWRKQLKKILEDTRRRTTEAWAKRPQMWAARPRAPRSAGLLQSPLALYHLVCISKIYTVDFKAVISRFIQRWSRELMRIDDVAIPCPLLHLSLYKDTQTLLLGVILKP